MTSLQILERIDNFLESAKRVLLWSAIGMNVGFIVWMAGMLVVIDYSNAVWMASVRDQTNMKSSVAFHQYSEDRRAALMHECARLWDHGPGTAAFVCGGYIQ